MTFPCSFVLIFSNNYKYYKDRLLTNQYSMNSIRVFFFVAHFALDSRRGIGDCGINDRLTPDSLCSYSSCCLLTPCKHKGVGNSFIPYVYTFFLVGHGPRKKKFAPISRVPWVLPVPSSIAVRCFIITLELLPSGQTLK